MLDAVRGTLAWRLIRALFPLRVMAPAEELACTLTVVFELMRTGSLVVGTVPKLQLVAADQSPPEGPVKVFVV